MARAIRPLAYVVLACAYPFVAALLVIVWVALGAVRHE